MFLYPTYCRVGICPVFSYPTCCRLGNCPVFFYPTCCRLGNCPVFTFSACMPVLWPMTCKTLIVLEEPELVMNLFEGPEVVSINSLLGGPAI